MTRHGIIKLGDFGISKVLAHTSQKLSTTAGTPYYMAPELFNGNKYDLKADIWSLGIILFDMMALEVPFRGSNPVK